MLYLRKLLPPLFLFTVLSGLSGCGHLSENVEDESVQQPSICEHQWLLERLSVDGREHRSRLLWQKLWRDRPYLICDKLGYVRGSAGNNPYLGRFTLSESGKISWSQAPAISRMGNVRDSSDLERAYLKALPQTDSLSVKGDSLILRGDAALLEFRRADGSIN